MTTTPIELPGGCIHEVTVAGPGRGESRFVRQMGPPGHYGHVVLTVEPTSESNFVLEWAVDESSIPVKFLPAILKGISATCTPGDVFQRCRFVHTKVRVIGGSTHEIDSKELSFTMAAHSAFTQAVARGQLKDHPTERSA